MVVYSGTSRVFAIAPTGLCDPKPGGWIGSCSIEGVEWKTLRKSSSEGLREKGIP